MEKKSYLYKKKLDESVSLSINYFNSSFDSKEINFRLSKSEDCSNFSLCIGILLGFSLGQLNKYSQYFEIFGTKIKNNLVNYYNERNKDIFPNNVNSDKNFLQLTSFSLAALETLNMFDQSIYDFLENILPKNIESYLFENKIHKGVPKSGNIAMCVFSILYYLDKHKKKTSYDKEINQWIEFHKKHLNKLGFYGKPNFKHLSFQNSFHQYEIFNFLKIKIDRQNSFEYLSKLKDKKGFFAPYFGGSGCYDYDAVVFFLHGDKDNNKTYQLFNDLFLSILKQQNTDGGFSDSQFLFPISLKNISFNFLHILKSPNMHVLIERIRYIASIYLKNKEKIYTHWSIYPRRWDESNLWDTWFRLLALKLIYEKSFDCKYNKIKKINFPGIGS